MMAPFRHRQEALQRSARLLAEQLDSGGGGAVRALVMYLWATQDRDTARKFGDELRDELRGPGGSLVTYYEELIQEGRKEGEKQGFTNCSYSITNGNVGLGVFGTT